MRLYEIYTYEHIRDYSFRKMHDALADSTTPIIKNFRYIGDDVYVLPKIYTAGDYDMFNLEEFGYTQIITREKCCVIDMDFINEERTTVGGVKYEMLSKFLSMELRDQSINSILK